ncbi:OmpA family protein [Paraherbaspirillum soli]|uniref:OmpA family protein n=1 Tax=Paraherbaspirillum soli TaxID=631222 RepID=A0ABW0M3L9_9BURK
MRHTIVLSLLLGSALSSAANLGFTQTTDIQANPTSSAYLQDGRGPIVRSQDGLCWRTGYWDSDSAVTGCDGELIPPIMKATAPALVTNPLAASTEAPPAPVVARCEMPMTLASDQIFGFSKATVTEAAKRRIDQEVIAKLKSPSCGSLDSIVVTGHTDRIGSEKYNQKLSEQRAANVATYLKSKGISAKMKIVGAGKSQSISNCSDKLSHQQLINCLSPDRRVLIEAQSSSK